MSTVVQHLVARCGGYYQTALQLGVILVGGFASFTKSSIEDFRTKSKYWCTPYPDELQLSMGLGNSLRLSLSTKCRQSTRAGTGKARAKKCRAFAHKGPVQSTTRSRRHTVSSNTSRLANTQTKARYAQTCRCRVADVSLSLYLGIIGQQRNATHDNAERAHCGHQVEACGRRLGGGLELARRTTGFRAPGCRTCRLVPSSIDYACRKWSRMARTDAPERAAGCPSTMPRGTAIRFRACIGRPCQRPGQLLAPSLPLAFLRHFIVVCCFVLLNRYWGINERPGVSSRASQECTYPRLKIADALPHPDLP